MKDANANPALDVDMAKNEQTRKRRYVIRDSLAKDKDVAGKSVIALRQLSSRNQR
jgi:hypothetical protein